MKIFYSPVDRQQHAIKLHVSDDGFALWFAHLRRNKDTGAVVDAADFADAPDMEVTYADLSARTDFADHTAYNLYGPDDDKDRPMQLFNFFEATKALKETGQAYAARTGLNSTASLIIPFASAPPSEWVLGLHVNSKEYFTVLGAEALAHPVDTVGGLGSLREITLPDVVFDQDAVVAQPGQVVSIAFAVMAANGQPYPGESEVYFEATGGSLLLSRVKSSGGAGQVLIAVPELPSGTSFKVKAGFKHYSGKAECKITVA